jgi:hypothetical protein
MGSNTLYGSNTFFYRNLRKIKLDCLRRMQRIINVDVSPCLQNLHHIRACIQLQNIKGFVVKMRNSYKIILHWKQYEFNQF